MNKVDDPFSRVFRDNERTQAVIDEIPAGVAADGTLFDETVYSEIRDAAAAWGEKVADVAQMTVMVPAGLWSFSQFNDFPDLDISTLGIENHRFFLFHSGAC